MPASFLPLAGRARPTRRPSFVSRAVLLLTCLVALNGCGYTYHFRDMTQIRGEEHNEWASYFIFGIVGDYEVNVKEFCPQGAAEVATGNNFATWFLRVITIGIYSPRKVIIRCSGGPSNMAAASFEVQFAETGAPSQVTKRVGTATFTGPVTPAGEGRYGVQLAEGAVQ